MIQQDRFFSDQVKLVFHTSANGWDDQEIGDKSKEKASQATEMNAINKKAPLTVTATAAVKGRF